MTAFVKPMREVQRRKLIAAARARTEPVAAARISTLLSARFKWVKKEVSRPGFTRRLGKALNNGSKLSKIGPSDDDSWSVWVDSFTDALTDVLAPVAVEIGDAEYAYWETRAPRPDPVDPAQILQEYQAREGKQIKNIGLTTRDLTLSTITDWYNTDAGLRELIASLSDIYSPFRAETIARTESTYITSQVATDLYDHFGVTYWNVDLGEEDGPWPCAICLAQADANPHDSGDDKPPYHPRCRCGTIPANADGGEFIYGADE